MSEKNKTTFFNTTVKEILAIFLFYFFFAWLYRIVLWYNGMWYEEEGIWGWTNLRGFWFASGQQYAFLLLASVLIWFFGYYLFRNKSRKWQILTVLLLLPIVTYFVREIRYMIVEAMGMNHLEGSGAIWDWYIPLLFLFIQFGCFFAYRYFRENERKIKLEGELRQAALKSELAAIKAQLNPHFLYNVFNTINASLPPENEKTRQMIAQLSDLFRYQLQASQTELVPLREELEFVKKYLDLEKARFDERLQIDINVPENLLDEMVPPMLLQPLVENSVKHGLASLINGGTISINIKKTEGKLKFEISDTGIGIREKTAAFEKGIGLNNTRLRLQKMYNSQMELLDNKPQGLKILFSI
ncbi:MULTISPECIES: sensor histidine kinase [Maribacter]|uniref:Histidine kinase n=1 Tax=Maribacter flavus TaxID=1658664 RepID=A0ABU7II28_9FLAO|nr:MULTISPECIES: histidine kinase [Maribacter]MDC6404949.1 histidine kinase [Maribacter sp. PR66]MEE1972363.1 histidine kinase [Maribacter flavus]